MKQSNLTIIFKALSNEQRLKIFMMIYDECCAPKGTNKMADLKSGNKACCSPVGSMDRAFTKMCDCLEISRSTISHHFKELQNAGLITCEREGQSFRCRVNKDAVNTIKEVFQ